MKITDMGYTIKMGYIKNATYLKILTFYFHNRNYYKIICICFTLLKSNLI